MENSYLARIFQHNYKVLREKGGRDELQVSSYKDG